MSSPPQQPPPFLRQMAFQKSHLANDSLVQYCISHSTPLHPCQQKLIDVTLKHPWAVMLGAKEVISMTCLIMHAIGAKKVLDIGVFTGYSALSAALAIPEDGKVVALDINDDYIKEGRPFWEEAGMAHKIDVRLQPATKSLDEMLANGEQDTFDYAFIDADKANYIEYYERCLKLVRVGGIIAVDNTLWGETVLLDETETPSANTKDIKAFNDHVAKDDRVLVSMLKIGDGVTLITRK